MSDFKNLPAVSFCETDGAKVEQETLNTYESVTENSLAAGNPERLNLEALAYIILLQLQQIDLAAKSNLLAFATKEKLDHLGALTDTPRLSACAAVTTIRFELGEVQDFAVVIPAGTRVTPDNKLMYSTNDAFEIAAGNLYVEIAATCQTAGTIGNGYIAGQINRLVDPIAGVVKIANTTVTLGGADEEKDDPYRERIQLSPEKASTAGPAGKYIYWARSVHQDISHVEAVSPAPGMVDVIALMAGGESPSTELLEHIYNTVSADKIRPLTDTVRCLGPEHIQYGIRFTYYIGSSNRAFVETIKNRVDEAVASFIKWQDTALGRDINPTKLSSLIEQAGAKRVVMQAPFDLKLTKYQVASYEGGKPAALYGGLEDD